MKRLYCLVIFTALFFLIGQGISQAISITFNDDTIYWAKTGSGYYDGWNDSNSWKSSDTTNNDNDLEYIGMPEFPDITAGTLTIDDDGYLTAVYFNYNRPNTLGAGDVFIDVNADYTWDYIIASGEEDGIAQGVYKVTDTFTFSAFKGANNDYYILSDHYYDDDDGNYRNNHPVQVSSNALSLLNKIDNNGIEFKGFDSNNATPVSFSDLDGINLEGEPFIIAFSPLCANDVIYEKVPEPTTVLLLGFGLVGLGLCSSYKMKKDG